MPNIEVDARRVEVDVHFNILLKGKIAKNFSFLFILSIGITLLWFFANSYFIKFTDFEMSFNIYELLEITTTLLTAITAVIGLPLAFILGYYYRE